MNVNTYLDRLLTKYSGSFNIYIPYKINEEEFPAYGYFYSHNEKFVLVKEANMWSADSYEHVLFLTEEEATADVVEKVKDLIKGYMEETLVRKGEKLPEENHMSSLLTVIILSQKSVSKDVETLIKKYSFDKGYNFNLRGYSRGRIALASMEDKKVIVSKAIKDSKKVLEAVFEEVEAGKAGFRELCQQQGVKPFVQEGE